MATYGQTLFPNDPQAAADTDARLAQRNAAKGNTQPSLAQILGLTDVGDFISAQGHKTGYAQQPGPAMVSPEPGVESPAQQIIAESLGAPAPDQGPSPSGDGMDNFFPDLSSMLFGSGNEGATPYDALQQGADELTRIRFSQAFGNNGKPQGPQDQTLTIQGVPMPFISPGGGISPGAFPELNTDMVAPDFSAADAAMEAARPKDYVEDKEDPLWGLMMGLANAASQVGPDTSVGNMLLQLGAGMLGGVGAARNASKAAMKEAEQRRAEFELKAAGYNADKAAAMARAAAENQSLKNEVALQKMRFNLDVAQANATAARADASARREYLQMSQPQISFDKEGGLIIQQFDPGTGQFTIKRQPAQASMDVLGGAERIATAGGGHGDETDFIVNAPLDERSKVTILAQRMIDKGLGPDIFGSETWALYNEKLAQLTGQTAPDENGLHPGMDAKYGALSGKDQNAQAQQLSMNLIGQMIYDDEMGPAIMRRILDAMD